MSKIEGTAINSDPTLTPPATNMQAAMPPEPMDAVRPNLRQESVLFATVKGVAAGAFFGAVLTLAGATYGALTKKTVSFGRAIRSDLGRDMAIWAGISGLVNFLGTGTRNVEREKIRPYVEKLEQEREILVQDVIKNNSR